MYCSLITDKGGNIPVVVLMCMAENLATSKELYTRLTNNGFTVNKEQMVHIIGLLAGEGIFLKH
jgi:hypothetical protein